MTKYLWVLLDALFGVTQQIARDGHKALSPRIAIGALVHHGAWKEDRDRRWKERKDSERDRDRERERKRERERVSVAVCWREGEGLTFPFHEVVNDFYVSWGSLENVKLLLDLMIDLPTKNLKDGEGVQRK